MDRASAKRKTPDSGREGILYILKTRGPMTAAQLARRLGVTSMAVHRHLTSLEEERLVVFTKQQPRIGRPAHLWQLTSKAHGRFPDGHANLAATMLEGVHAAFGADGLKRLTEEWTRRQIETYRERMPEPDAPIAKRVEALAQLRRAEGFMAEWGHGCDGTIEFVEHHCPIARAAHACPGLCDGELALFRAVLGDDVQADRLENVLDGDLRCAYRIVERDRDAPADEGSEAPCDDVDTLVPHHGNSADVATSSAWPAFTWA